MGKAGLKELKVRVSPKNHTRLHALKMLRGAQLGEVVSKALEVYFDELNNKFTDEDWQEVFGPRDPGAASGLRALPRAECVVCDGEFAVRQNGTIYAHRDRRTLARKPKKKWCPGGGDPPKRSVEELGST